MTNKRPGQRKPGDHNNQEKSNNVNQPLKKVVSNSIFHSKFIQKKKINFFNLKKWKLLDITAIMA